VAGPSKIDRRRSCGRGPPRARPCRGSRSRRGRDRAQEAAHRSVVEDGAGEPVAVEDEGAVLADAHLRDDALDRTGRVAWTGVLGQRRGPEHPSEAVVEADRGDQHPPPAPREGEPSSAATVGAADAALAADDQQLAVRAARRTPSSGVAGRSHEGVEPGIACARSPAQRGPIGGLSPRSTRPRRADADRLALTGGDAVAILRPIAVADSSRRLRCPRPKRAPCGRRDQE
jgi:hypothetical protein